MTPETKDNPKFCAFLWTDPWNPDICDMAKSKTKVKRTPPARTQILRKHRFY
jgi:hypothetical protein